MTNDTNNNGGSTALAERPIQSQIQRRETRIVEDSGVLANLMDTARFEHLQRIATLMATMSLLPDHLKLDRDKRMLAPEAIRANCFRVTNQALRWGIDPFAMVDETYVVSGKLGYQGKLVAAVVNVRAGLKQRLSYRFEGTGENRSVIVSGTFEGEETPRESSLRYGDAKTSNQMWTKDPDQKLIYSGVVKWARRYCPEVVLGVLTDDDIDRMQQQAAAATAIGSRTLAQQFNESTAPVLEAPTFPGLKTEISEEEANRLIEQRAAQARAAQQSSAPQEAPGGDAANDQSSSAGGAGDQHADTINVNGVPWPVALPDSARTSTTFINDAIQAMKPAKLTTPAARKKFHEKDVASWDLLPSERQDQKYAALMDESIWD